MNKINLGIFCQALTFVLVCIHASSSRSQSLPNSLPKAHQLTEHRPKPHELLLGISGVNHQLNVTTRIRLNFETNFTPTDLLKIRIDKENDDVDITPGILVITNPEHDASKSSIVIGTIRTVWRF